METIGSENCVPVGGLSVNCCVEGPLVVHIDFQVQEVDRCCAKVQAEPYVGVGGVQVVMEVLKRSSQSPRYRPA